MEIVKDGRKKPRCIRLVNRLVLMQIGSCFYLQFYLHKDYQIGNKNVTIIQIAIY